LGKLEEWRVERFEPEGVDEPSQGIDYGRSEFEVDRDRILYSGHFLRLAEVTQTVSPIHGYVFHNRLSHSLKVGHVSRRIAEYLLRWAKKDKAVAEAIKFGKGLDPTVAELAGFAHDLGHPPFGHVAEEVLKGLALHQLEIDSFEGNAQTFRILTSLAAGDVTALDRKRGMLGLNLTRASLNAVSKYPWAFQANDSKKREKFGCYSENEEENKILAWARNGLDAGVRTLEASIMDWADDVTFSIHDLLDFYSAGQIPLYAYIAKDEKHKKEVVNSSECEILLSYILGTEEKKEHFTSLIEEVKKKNPRKLHKGKLKATLSRFLVEKIYAYFSSLTSRYTGSLDQRDAMAIAVSRGIGDCISAVSLDRTRREVGPDGVFRVSAEQRLFVELLKQFTWHYVIDGYGLAADQLGHRHAVQKAFEVLRQSAQKEPFRAFVFPPHIRGKWGETLGSREKREIIDYIASMSEPELMRFYKQVTALNSY
jgi:dGTPase